MVRVMVWGVVRRVMVRGKVLVAPRLLGWVMARVMVKMMRGVLGA